MNPKDVAIAAAKEAGKKLLELSKNPIKYSFKNPHDILAEGDLLSEKIIVEKIKQYFPTHSILSEEQGDDKKESDYKWVIDPIDGTINFARNIEEYCISIALTKKDERILGVVYQPAINKLFIAEKGKGTFLNNQKITVSKETKLINTIGSTDNAGIPPTRTQNFLLLEKVSTKVRQMRIFGSSALHLARLASGQLDFHFKVTANYWDYAAAAVLVEEAGGKVTDFLGLPFTKESKNIVASNGLLHKNVLQLLLGNYK